MTEKETEKEKVQPKQARIMSGGLETTNILAPPGMDFNRTIDAPEVTPTVEWENPGDFIIGVYRGFRPDIGPNNSRLYNLFALDGQIVSIWGATILDSKMDLLNPPWNCKIMIQYLGEVTTSRGMNPAKNFRISFERPPKQDAKEEVPF